MDNEQLTVINLTSELDFLASTNYVWFDTGKEWELAQNPVPKLSQIYYIKVPQLLIYLGFYDAIYFSIY